MTWLQMPHEQRRTMRVCSKGAVMLRCGSRLIRGRIHDLAAGGVNVHAELPLGFQALTGRCVHVDLGVGERAPRWFALDGHVVRASVGTKTIAVAFDAVPSAYEDWVQDRLLEAIEHDQLPPMILLDVDTFRRTAIADALREVGCRVTEAATPLAALAHLARATGEAPVIVLPDSIDEAVAEELREALERTTS